MTGKVKRIKLAALCMAGIMSVSAVLAGCGNKDASPDMETKKTSAGTKSGGQTTSSESTAANGKTGDNKLVIAMGKDPLVTDYDDNNLTKYYEEKLGIDIEFMMIPGSELETKLSLMATSGEDLPDILLAQLSNEAVLQYGTEGLFLSVADYLEDASVMPNFNAVPEEDKEAMLKAATMVDGNMYGFPYSAEMLWNLTPYRYYLNRTWLDKLGLPVPETLEQLKDVLIAFRDKDPNGNGIQDEIPLYGRTEGYGMNVIWALMNSFTFYNGGSVNNGLAVDANDTIYAPYVTEEWKQGLLYMNDLYQEGLMAPGIFTDDDTQFKAVLNSETNVVGCVTTGSYGVWADTINNANFHDMEMVAPFTGPEGVCYTPYSPYEPVLKGYIFNDSDKIDLAIRFMDECYNAESQLVARYGVEGEHWTKDPEELKGLENCFTKAGLYDEVTMALYNNIWSVAGNVTWRDAAPRYMSADDINTLVDITNGREYNPDMPTNLQAFNMKYYSEKHPQKVLSSLKYTAEEAESILDAVLNITEYVNQSVAEFITGARDIEKGWDSYLAELENMGLSDLLHVAQNAYDRTLE